MVLSARQKLKRSLKRQIRQVKRKIRVSKSMVTYAPSHTHYFKRTFNINTNGWVRNDGTYAGQADNGQFMAYWNMNFSLSNLPNATDFTNLYDCYQVLGIKVKFIPYHNVGENAINNAPGTAGNGSTVGSVPYLTYAIDRDGGIATTAGAANTASQNALLQYANCKTIRLDRPKSIYIKAPGYYDTNATQNTSVEVNYGNRKKWLDMNHTGVVFNGLQTAIAYPYMWAVSGTDGGTPVAYPNKIQTIVTFYFRCKNAR